MPTPKEAFRTTEEGSGITNHTFFDTPILSHFLHRVAGLILRVIRWRALGETPTPDKYVLIAAPHTSNWDLPIMLTFGFYYGVKIYWMGKESLFRGIYGPIMRYLGGIPIDRSKPGGMVGQTIAKFNESERLVIVVPPEGTRQKALYWKSGFYHIAHGANIPIVLGFLDYGRKEGSLEGLLKPTGDIDADMAVIREHYADIQARHPEKKSPVELSPQTRSDDILPDASSGR